MFMYNSEEKYMYEFPEDTYNILKCSKELEACSSSSQKDNQIMVQSTVKIITIICNNLAEPQDYHFKTN